MGDLVYPYLDPVGYATIGWGSRYDKNGNIVTMSTKPITFAEAESLLLRDVANFSYIVNRDCYNLNQNQFDALVSFCYNLGNVNGLKDKVNSKTITKSDFLMYSYAKGIFLQGLYNRRGEEANLYFKQESLLTTVRRWLTSKNGLVK